MGIRIMATAGDCLFNKNNPEDDPKIGDKQDEVKGRAWLSEPSCRALRRLSSIPTILKKIYINHFLSPFSVGLVFGNSQPN